MGEKYLIYVEPTWKLHSGYETLVRYPPDGYAVEADTGLAASSIRWASQFRGAYSLLAALDPVMPVHLFMSYLRRFRHPPAGTRLTYAVSHLVLRNEPWVLDLTGEHVTNLLGGVRHFQRFKRTVETVLASPNCRAVVVDKNVTREALEATLDVDLTEKVRLVTWAVPRKRFIKTFNGSRIRLLFVGSANIPGQFHNKGGKEALETFLLLRARFPHVEMTLRCDLPGYFKRRFGNVEGLKIIDRILPWRELELEFMNADILVVPSHIPLVWVFLDALSYELPVVTADAWGNNEIVEDGVTGLIVHDRNVAAHYQEMLPRCFVPHKGSAEYRRIIESTDRDMVQELVEKLSLLIESAELRRRLGLAGREAVEHGRFSIDRRNASLRRVLDEALEKNASTAIR